MGDGGVAFNTGREKVSMINTVKSYAYNRICETIIM